MKLNQRVQILLAISIAAIGGMSFVQPIAQDPAYHDLIDKRVIWGIPHFGDVVSNVVFLIVGVMGIGTLLKVRNDRSRLIDIRESVPFAVAFIGTGLIFAGSAYYHWAPANDTLLWDRLPMTFAFMGIFCVILGDRVNVRASLILLGPLLLVGVASVVYWHITEQAGRGDLRPYALVQFLPLVLIPVIFWLYPARYTGWRYVMEMIGWYMFAKVFEFSDALVWHWTGEVISGHSLKHLTAAWGIYALVRYLKNRRAVLPAQENTAT